MINKLKLKKVLWILDIIVFTISFLLLHFRKFSFFLPTENYLYLYLIFITFWIIFSVYYDKINKFIDKPIWLVIRIVFWSSVTSLLFVVIVISFSDLWSISRIFVATFTLIIIAYELLITLFVKLYIGSKIIIDSKKSKIETQSSNKFYLKWLIPGIVFLLMSYVFIVSYNTGTFKYDILNEQNVLVLISAWGLSTLLTNRYKEPNTINHYYEIAPYIKSFILTFLFLTFFYYSLRISSSSIKLIYQAGFLHSGLEILTFFLYFFGASKKNGTFINSVEQVNSFDDRQEALKIENDIQNKNDIYTKNELSDNIKTFGFKYGQELTNFIWESINTEQLSKNRVTILNTISTVNIELLYNNSRNLLVNIHPLNDFRRINEYFLSSYSKIESGGIFIGCFIPLENIKNHLRKQMPQFLFSIILPFHFIFHRVFPKLTITKQIYFILTRGKNRVISKSEILGRLAFCGYEIKNEINLGGKFYFVCKKKKTISNEKFPSYGPIVKLKRVGYLGKPVYIYKLRTMYPYSEFIQGDIYEKYHLDSSGKIKEDYRITSWGKVFRKYFIDELPQIYNWIKGDLKLMGVRALSEHYYGLYPKELQEKRIKIKPGLIPPFYADLPKSFDEILKSEKNYLNKKQKSPFMTDLKYFMKAISNILFSNARSR